MKYELCNEGMARIGVTKLEKRTGFYIEKECDNSLLVKRSREDIKRMQLGSYSL